METSISDGLLRYVQKAKAHSDTLDHDEMVLEALQIALGAFSALVIQPYSACSPQVRKWLSCVSELSKY